MSKHPESCLRKPSIGVVEYNSERLFHTKAHEFDQCAKKQGRLYTSIDVVHGIREFEGSLG